MKVYANLMWTFVTDKHFVWISKYKSLRFNVCCCRWIKRLKVFICILKKNELFWNIVKFKLLKNIQKVNILWIYALSWKKKWPLSYIINWIIYITNRNVNRRTKCLYKCFWLLKYSYHYWADYKFRYCSVVK